MKSIRPTTVTEKSSPENRYSSLFEKPNLLWMAMGLAIMIIGFLLMSGGRSEDPNVFNPGEVYSTTRITVAPILILVGLVVLVISLFRKPRNR